jgi:hypothetical protein
MLEIYLHLRDGTVRTLTYDCNDESPFQALERVYRSADDFMVYQIEKITFQQ